MDTQIVVYNLNQLMEVELQWHEDKEEVVCMDSHMVDKMEVVNHMVVEETGTWQD